MPLSLRYATPFANVYNTNSSQKQSCWMEVQKVLRKGISAISWFYPVHHTVYIQHGSYFAWQLAVCCGEPMYQHSLLYHVIREYIYGADYLWIEFGTSYRSSKIEGLALIFASWSQLTRGSKYATFLASACKLFLRLYRIKFMEDCNMIVHGLTIHFVALKYSTCQLLIPQLIDYME